MRALTGTNTDRLKQEQERGITIELGYAYLPLPDGQVLGIIDVPGHEKFIHTMAAGAVGIDHALLVVAADDGVMPQTLEHVQILQLLGIRSASVAITKADCVPPERVTEVQEEVRAILSVTAMAEAPLFATAAAQPDDPGTWALRQHLLAQAQHHAARSSTGLFRLAVDRAFSLTGQGTIVTGTVFGGQVSVGDSLTHSGSGRSVRVRSLHAQNRASPSGSAGQRVALNLAGVSVQDIARGDWLADARALRASQLSCPAISGRDPHAEPMPLNTRATVLVTLAATGGRPTAIRKAATAGLVSSATRSTSTATSTATCRPVHSRRSRLTARKSKATSSGCWRR